MHNTVESHLNCDVPLLGANHDKDYRIQPQFSDRVKSDSTFKRSKYAVFPINKTGRTVNV